MTRLALLINHAYEVEKSDPMIFPVLAVHPQMLKAARTLTMAARQGCPQLEEKAQFFEGVLLQVQNSQVKQSRDKTTNGKAKDRFVEVAKARAVQAEKKAGKRRNTAEAQAGLLTLGGAR